MSVENAVDQRVAVRGPTLHRSGQRAADRGGDGRHRARVPRPGARDLPPRGRDAARASTPRRSRSAASAASAAAGRARPVAAVSARAGCSPTWGRRGHPDGGQRRQRRHPAGRRRARARTDDGGPGPATDVGPDDVGPTSRCHLTQPPTVEPGATSPSRDASTCPGPRPHPAAHRPPPRRHRRPRRHHPASRPIGVITMSTTSTRVPHLPARRLRRRRAAVGGPVHDRVGPVVASLGAGRGRRTGYAGAGRPGRRSTGHRTARQHGTTTSTARRVAAVADPVAVASTAATVTTAPELRRGGHGRHGPRSRRARPPRARPPRRGYDQVRLRRRLRLLRARGRRDRARPRRRGAGRPVPAAQPVAPRARGHPRGRAVARLRRRRPRDPGESWRSRRSSSRRARTGWSAC